MSDIVERDIYEVANQLGGYVGPDTPERLKLFLLKEEKAAVALADEIVLLRSELANANRHIEALQEKGTSECACSYDRPDDVCLFYTQMKANARNAALEEAAVLISKTPVCELIRTDEDRPERIFENAAGLQSIQDEKLVRSLKTVMPPCGNNVDESP